MHIRKANTSDIQALQEIARRVIINNYTSFLGYENVEYFIGSGQADKEILDGMEHCYIAGQGNTTIGFAVTNGSTLHLIMIDVPFQNKGHGAALLAFIEQKMFEDYPTIKLQTFEGNVNTVHFYEKKGWAIESVEYVEGMDMNMLHMQKSLV